MPGCIFIELYIVGANTLLNAVVGECNIFCSKGTENVVIEDCDLTKYEE